MRRATTKLGMLKRWRRASRVIATQGVFRRGVIVRTIFARAILIRAVNARTRLGMVIARAAIPYVSRVILSWPVDEAAGPNRALKESWSAFVQRG
jgi:hypothetical protein